MGNLVSRDEVKTFMQVTTTNTDALIDVYISFVEAEVDSVTKRNLARATYTESLAYLQSTFDKTGYTLMDASNDAMSLFLKNIPVVSINSITSGGTAQPTTTYHLNSDNGEVKTTFQYADPTATYVAGYTTVTCPADLKGVIELGVTSLFANNKAATQGSGNVKSKSIKDFSVTYGNEQTGYVTLANGQLVKNYIASNEHILKRYTQVNL